MGRTLEEIDLAFRDSPSVWATVRFAKQRPHDVISETHQEKLKVEHKEHGNQ